ncbi:biotin/lipoyl-containing protein [Alkalitalea saponilacus]|uniref:Biotin-requiring enzyme n=1 Tax=Alkalitalea saponilacus TaxID=889453 RepID=A0A1T5HSJ6_9BACT|nr:biotin/lipoyl-containing protein [Alkalitalea saponilacus]ASB47733.1 acetyl-CoA carboxylase biotin carboxyl carrier protein subunit [Alkalitalea saponilacus]SKC23664.1 Biotin-requiring enzyme [Alkalitalea saponilacus]
MKKYLITVNEKQYEVEVEEVRATTARAVQTLKSAPKLKTPVTAGNGNGNGKAAAAASGGHKVSAPMPGNVFKVLVAPGDEVKKGQVLLVFEAMKMENDLTSPADGVVREVNAVEGNAIAVGEVLVVVE